VLTGAIDAALSIPAAVRVATDPEADPEKRGAAAVQAAQNITAVVATVAGATSTIKNAGNGGSAGPKQGSAGGPSAGKRFPEKGKNDAEAAAGGRCVFCGRETTRTRGPGQRNTDHAIPRSRGGDNSPENAQNTCRECNQRKGAKTTEEYLRDKR
jgi:HNH endonuclease